MRFNRVRSAAGILTLCAGSAFASPAYAGPIVGGSTILNSASVAQLETWFGQGEQTFTNIFTKTAGSNALNFHAAADNIPGTFTLLKRL